MAIPIIDIFAGPGGLGEGFSSVIDKKGNRFFQISLSIEKDPEAHKTLLLRSFFRQFKAGSEPKDYFDFIRGEISLSTLREKWPKQWAAASQEAWCATLGDSKDSIDYHTLDKRIQKALNGSKQWALIGGPPCQAYSVVGRSRRQEKMLDESKDERVGLYKQYLRILAKHNPAVFIMENVKGLLSAETEKSSVFTRILEDLKNPVKACLSEFDLGKGKLSCPGYKIYSLASAPDSFDVHGAPIYEHKKFVIKSEEYGIPQSRHRVILFGIRNDISFSPKTLQKQASVPISSVVSDLPKIRSGVSKAKDSTAEWLRIVNTICDQKYLNELDKELQVTIKKQLSKLATPKYDKGLEYIKYSNNDISYRGDWYSDKRIAGVCNHTSRSHMPEDILRYFFAACYAKTYHRSPRIADFPRKLLPKHKNVKQAIEDKKFADRFRVQLSDVPSKTVTSHISKDGHYFIYYEPTQCRSFTVREAARIQTFPDNYFFCGTRTSQFHQVGNAVPPLLAHQIALIVKQVFV